MQKLYSLNNTHVKHAWIFKGGLISALLFSLSACGPNAGKSFHSEMKTPVQTHSDGTSEEMAYNPRIPAYAARSMAPFNREDVVAIAKREWRLFGEPVADLDPRQAREVSAPPQTKPERQAGLWQRIGEYWWIGQPLYGKEAWWTGLSANGGAIFPADQDGQRAWSAAFISYVMRVAGAGNRFFYAPNHSSYINAAIRGTSHGLKGKNPALYVPKEGDLLCTGRGASRNITFSDLPTSAFFPAHCGIVITPPQFGSPFGRQIAIIGGNVEDQVALTHVPVDEKGYIADKQGKSLDPRFPWCVILAPDYVQDHDPLQYIG